jgi:PII-like signaling protein
VVRARYSGMAGATVFRGYFGDASCKRRRGEFIESLDSEDKANAFHGGLDQLRAGIVVTMEKVEMLRFSPNLKADSPAAPFPAQGAEHRKLVRSCYIQG